jgi:hypothetical protein
LAQKVEIIVNDDIQWLKLQQSLRDHADGLWTSLAVQQVLHIYVQQRIDEMERLELALLEPNGPPKAVASNDTASNSTINNDPVAIAVAEEVGVVYAVKKFARRASQLATQSYLAPHNTAINNNNQSTKFDTSFSFICCQVCRRLFFKKKGSPCVSALKYFSR